MIIRLGKIFLCSLFLFQFAFTQTTSTADLHRFRRKVDTGTILFLFQNKNLWIIEHETIRISDCF